MALEATVAGHPIAAEALPEIARCSREVVRLPLHKGPAQEAQALPAAVLIVEVHQTLVGVRAAVLAPGAAQGVRVAILAAAQGVRAAVLLEADVGKFS